MKSSGKIVGSNRLTKKRGGLCTERLCYFTLAACIIACLLPLPKGCNLVYVLGEATYPQSVISITFAKPTVFILALAASLYTVVTAPTGLRPTYMLISAFWLNMVANSDNSAGLVCTSFFIPLFLSSLVSEQSAHRTVQLIVILASINCFVAIEQYILGQGQFMGSGNIMRISGVYGSPNVLYGIAMVGSLLSLEQALSCVHSRSFWLFCFACCTIALFATLSRAAYVGWTLGTIYLIVSSRNRGVLALAGIIAALSIQVLLACKFRSLSSLNTDLSSIGRYHIWQATLQLIRTRPFWGYGSSSFLRLMPGVRPGSLCPGEAKSLILTLGLEDGLQSLIVFVALIYVITSFVRGAAYRGAQRIQNASISVWIATLSAGLFDTPILCEVYRAPHTILALVMVGLLLNPRQRESLYNHTEL